MSILTDIDRTIRKAIDQRREPVAIKFSERSLIRIAEALRRDDVERRNFALTPIGGVPHIWNPREQEYQPIRPSFYFFKGGGIDLEIPFVISPLIPDDRFLMEFSDKPLVRKKVVEQPPIYSTEPKDTGRME